MADFMDLKMLAHSAIEDGFDPDTIPARYHNVHDLDNGGAIEYFEEPNADCLAMDAEDAPMSVWPISRKLFAQVRTNSTTSSGSATPLPQKEVRLQTIASALPEETHQETSRGEKSQSSTQNLKRTRTEANMSDKDGEMKANGRPVAAIEEMYCDPIPLRTRGALRALSASQPIPAPANKAILTADDTSPPPAKRRRCAAPIEAFAESPEGADEQYPSDESIDLWHNDEGEFEVEEIVDHRGVDADGVTRIEYRVRWKHCGPESDTWEPEANLDGAPELLHSYRARCVVTRSASETANSAPPSSTASSIQPTKVDRSNGDVNTPAHVPVPLPPAPALPVATRSSSPPLPQCVQCWRPTTDGRPMQQRSGFDGWLCDDCIVPRKESPVPQRPPPAIEPTPPSAVTKEATASADLVSTSSLPTQSQPDGATSTTSTSLPRRVTEEGVTRTSIITLTAIRLEDVLQALYSITHYPPNDTIAQLAKSWRLSRKYVVAWFNVMNTKTTVPFSSIGSQFTGAISVEFKCTQCQCTASVYWWRTTCQDAAALICGRCADREAKLVPFKRVEALPNCHATQPSQSAAVSQSTSETTAASGDVPQDESLGDSTPGDFPAPPPATATTTPSVPSSFVQADTSTAEEGAPSLRRTMKRVFWTDEQREALLTAYYLVMYPTEEQKIFLSETLGLSLTQVMNWFVNARRRVGRNPNSMRNVFDLASLKVALADPVIRAAAAVDGFNERPPCSHAVLPVPPPRNVAAPAREPRMAAHEQPSVGVPQPLIPPPPRELSLACAPWDSLGPPPLRQRPFAEAFAEAVDKLYLECQQQEY